MSDYDDDPGRKPADEQRVEAAIKKLGAEIQKAEAAAKQSKKTRTASREDVVEAGRSLLVRSGGKLYRVSPEGQSHGKPVVDPQTKQPVIDPRTGAAVMKFPKQYLMPVKIAPTATRALTLEKRELKEKVSMAKSKAKAAEERAERHEKESKLGPPSLYTLHDHPIVVTNKLVTSDPHMITLSAVRYGSLAFIRFQADFSLHYFYDMAGVLAREGAVHGSPPFNTMLVFPMEDAALNYVMDAMAKVGNKFQVLRENLDFLRDVAELKLEEFAFRTKSPEAMLRELMRATTKIELAKQKKEPKPEAPLAPMSPEEALISLGLDHAAPPSKIDFHAASLKRQIETAITDKEAYMVTLTDDFEKEDTQIEIDALKLRLSQISRWKRIATQGAQERYDAYRAERREMLRKAESMQPRHPDAPPAFPAKPYKVVDKKAVEMTEEEIEDMRKKKQAEASISEPEKTAEGSGSGSEGEGGTTAGIDLSTSDPEEGYVAATVEGFGNGGSQPVDDDAADDDDPDNEAIVVDEDGDLVEGEEGDEEGEEGDEGDDEDEEDEGGPLEDPEGIEEVEIEYQGENVRQGNAFTDGMTVFGPPRSKGGK